MPIMAQHTELKVDKAQDRAPQPSTTQLHNQAQHRDHMDMSSSSNGEGVIKFRSKICYCGSKATIKVTESEKNRGKLYYLCPHGKCSFWDWCKPINSFVGGQMMMEDTEATVNRHTLPYEEDTTTVNLMNQIGAMQTRMQVLEANMGFVKIVMIMNVVLCLISLMVALKM
ncbi:unnamed protein product [Camellia sinensis]